MNDIELETKLRAVLLEALADAGLSECQVVLGYQPKQQGAPATPVITFYRIGPDVALGHPRAHTHWDDASQTMMECVTQFIEATYQIECLHTENRLTAPDILRALRMRLQTPEGIKRLRCAGLGVFRIRDMRLRDELDDQNRYVKIPSFDLVLGYSITESALTAKVSTQEIITGRV